MSEVKIFIGSSSNGEDAPIESIYEYTLRKNTDRELNITWMRQRKEGFWSGFNTPKWSTPFSGYRWVIPELCNFEGKAIYTDCDMINFKDIGELYDTDLEGKPLAARKGKRFGGHEFCVMVIDCKKMKDFLVPVDRQRVNEFYHHRMIAQFSGNDELVKELDPRWNCLDGENRSVDDMYQLHWTNMATQPWCPPWYTGERKEHPRQDLVDLYTDMMIESTDAGYTGDKYEYEYAFQYNIIGK